jgi:hypothetical protein
MVVLAPKNFLNICLYGDKFTYVKKSSFSLDYLLKLADGFMFVYYSNRKNMYRNILLFKVIFMFAYFSNHRNLTIAH